jgi:uncharacterized iron-regulated membrane protein
MRFLRFTHKWLALIVGIQLFLWTLSGMVFAVLDHHEVSAEHSVRMPDTPQLPADGALVEPHAWLDDYAADSVRGIRLMPLLDRWVYRVELPNRVELRDARDGGVLVIDAPLAGKLAAARYAGDGALREVVHHPQSTLEARKAGPVWQTTFTDAQNTALYFSAADGRFVAARNDTWRMFDFFWMLHTMDYRGRDDFNNSLVILVASGTLWLAVSGVILLFRAFRPVRG